MNEEFACCTFCHPDGILLENDLAYILLDNSTVNLGYSQIIPKRHQY
jgi:diadenosine tetraphosphate (Ap4A) HIT family hydrolase